MNKAKLARRIILTYVAVLYSGVMATATGQIPFVVYFFGGVIFLAGLIGIGMSISYAVQHVNDYEDHS